MVKYTLKTMGYMGLKNWREQISKDIPNKRGKNMQILTDIVSEIIADISSDWELSQSNGSIGSDKVVFWFLFVKPLSSAEPYPIDALKSELLEEFSKRYNGANVTITSNYPKDTDIRIVLD